MQDPHEEIETPAERTERGASLVEYALLTALIAIVCIGAVTFVGQKNKSFYSDATSQMFLQSVEP